LPGNHSAHFAGPLEPSYQIIEHRPHCADEGLPGIGYGSDIVSVALEEQITLLVLKLLHLPTEIGLSNIQARRCLAKMKFARHRQDELRPSEITIKIDTHVLSAPNEVVFLGGRRAYRR